MRRYYIDGSCKGIAMGAGIAEIDGIGFMQVHSFHCYHLDTTPLLAETFAFECVLNLIQEQNPADRHIEIITDSDQVYHLFTSELTNPTNNLYIQSLKNRTIPLSRYLRFQVKRENEATEKLLKVAHLLSRNYLDDTIATKIIQQSSSLNFLKTSIGTLGFIFLIGRNLDIFVLKRGRCSHAPND